MERPFLVTLFITLSSVSSRITRSNSCKRRSLSVSHQQTFGEHGHKSNELSYQKAVEELMNKEAQDADDGIPQMVDKEHVHHDCFVASSERPLVPHKTYKKHQLVEKLKME